MKKMLFVFICVVPVFCAEANDLKVCKDGGALYTTIQSAINAAVHGDTVTVCPGTYNESIRFGGRRITVQSEDPNDPGTVETTIIEYNAGYAVSFDFNEGRESIITGFSIVGGGIYCYDSSPTIKGNIIRNSNRYGITGDLAPTPAILNNTITLNSPGGVIACGGSIEGNTISHNGGEGGLLDCGADIRFNVISNNEAIEGGGLSGCPGFIVGNLIIVNRASEKGGGLFKCDGEITHNIISGNRAFLGGGFYGCDGRVFNNTITGNRADEGGAMWDCFASIWYNIIAFNEAGDTGGISGSSRVNSFNCFWDNDGNFGRGASAGPGDIDAAPGFAERGHWDANGTPGDLDDDYWVDGDYHVKSEKGRWDAGIEMWVYDGVTSPCIDMNDPGADWTGEYWPHDELVDFRDMMLLTNKWPGRRILAREDLDRSGWIDSVDFAILTANWLPWPKPTPNPMNWKREPYGASSSSIAMDANEAVSSDGSGVEYYFEETSGNPGGNDSGWLPTSTYTDYDLQSGKVYSYRVRARNWDNHIETDWSDERSAATFSGPGPDPMTWAAEPNAIFYHTITMRAATGVSSDGSGVEYYFTEFSGHAGGVDSGWQDSPVYTNTGLSPETSYCYVVKARNKGNKLETGDSEGSCAMTPPMPPPTPSPMEWAQAPANIWGSGDRITMLAVDANSSDGSGVEYYFAETSGNSGGADSAWQESPSYTNTGLSPSTGYCYMVKARNKGDLTETEWSQERCATTDHERIPPEPNPMEWEPGLAPREVHHGGDDFQWWAEMTAKVATDDNPPIQYWFECMAKGEPVEKYSSDVWQESPYYEVWLGRPNQLFGFHVKARDGYGNETAYSVTVIARPP